MTRRGLVGLIMVAPAMARQALTEGKWLTVALPGWNRNNRKYSEAALVSMKAGLVGRWIIKRVEGEGIPDEEGLLALAVGMVTDTRRGEDGSVDVKVKWLSDAAGVVEGVLAPAGIGIRYEEVKPGHYEITEYESQCLELTEWSGWEGATRV